jgi:PhnB protein
MPDLERLQDFFARYGEALSAGDLTGIADCYALPALVLSDVGSIPVAAREEIEAAFEGAAERYRARGLVAVRPTILRSEEITAALASVDVVWDYLDEQGHAAQHNGYRYIVRLDESLGPLIQTVIETPGVRPPRRAATAGGVAPIPEGFHTVTPYVTVKGAVEAIEFYKRAFGAKEIFRWSDPDGSVRHAEVVIGDSPVMLTDEAPEFGMVAPQSPGGSPVHLFLYVDDADAVFEAAVAAGATELMPVEDSSDGDRRGGVTDPFGHVWYIATHVEGVSREELQARYDAMAKHQQPG